MNDWYFNEGASSLAIQAAAASVGQSLPPDYWQLLSEHDGGEGFVREHYLMLWRCEELAIFNREYEVERHAPGIVLFGSDGGGEGYGFDTREESVPIVQIPFIGMSLEYATRVADSFADFWGAADAIQQSSENDVSRIPRGMELHHITPVMLGGDPGDRNNQTWLTRQQHIEVVRYWNRVIRDLRKGAGDEGHS